VAIPPSRPLVERDFDEPSPKQDANRQEQRQIEDVGSGQTEALAVAPGEQVHLQETECVAQPVPPQVYARNRSDDGIDAVHEWAQHAED
jgi:hypothetical protein